MATNMAVAMAAWMRFRGHGWAAALEMSAAMYVPFLVPFPPLWLDLLSGHAMMLVGHVLMLPAMVAAMLLRPAEYAGHTHEHNADLRRNPHDLHPGHRRHDLRVLHAARREDAPPVDGVDSVQVNLAPRARPSPSTPPARTSTT